MRYLGIDLGSKRIGLALGDAKGLVTPLKALTAGASMERNAHLVLEVADEYGADEIVIGLPLNMDDTEGPQARPSRQLAEAIHQLGGPPVHLHDERLSSHAADARLRERDLTRGQKKARQDALAAQCILQSYVEHKNESTT